MGIQDIHYVNNTVHINKQFYYLITFYFMNIPMEIFLAFNLLSETNTFGI